LSASISPGGADLPTASDGRGAANSALASGIVWLLLALAPVPGTTLLGLPFGVYALVRGWLSARERRAAGDRGGARRAGWGIGLGCVGFIYVTAFFFIAGGLLIAGAIAALHFIPGTPVP
jgi:hypothetical protein